MAYGQTDEIIKEREARMEAVSWLLEVAVGTTTQQDVRGWLEKNYPELCVLTKEEKKWQFNLLTYD